MRRFSKLLTCAIVVLTCSSVFAQPPARVPYNKQQLFLSGANLAWMSYANDIGPGMTDTTTFGDILLKMHNHGGNVVRWWLHTTGTGTPEFNDTGLVIGPGTNAISNLRHALDIAWQREVGVVLSLWSFGMLDNTLSPSVYNHNLLLLTDTNYTRAYINNSLIPMIDSLRGHPAIVAWEIFNEPEGMSTEYGWGGIGHVPMATIQRFINLCAGAIHRADSTALITNGTVSFQMLTDVPVATVKAKTRPTIPLTSTEMLTFAQNLKAKYRMSISTDEIIRHIAYVNSLQNFNYYLDSRLIAAGGDSLGTLDFYEAHFYYANNGPSNSPFSHPASIWGLTKPIIVGEFPMTDSSHYGLTHGGMFDTLYKAGYAGALPWSWTDEAFSTQAAMLDGMQYMWNNHQADVKVLGVGQYWPSVSITSPPNDTVYADSASVHIVAAVSDSGSGIVSVKFFANDAPIGQATTAPFAVTWAHPPAGSYALTATATDSLGHYQTSSPVHIIVGIPPMINLEAESATHTGTGITVKTDANASGGSYLDVATSTGSVTWHFTNVDTSGIYPITFGFKLNYDHPKYQYLVVNGVTVDTVLFDGTTTTTWYTTTLPVFLQHGVDTVTIGLFWGWMSFDYLGVPTNVLTSVPSQPAVLPLAFGLQQNYPNPFNPTTVIRGQWTGDSWVTLNVYDVLGRKVAELANGRYPAGKYSFTFNGSGLASGVYFYRLTAGGHTSTMKMMLMK